MKTTLDLPETLVAEAMALTHISTKTEVIKRALEKLIRAEKIKDIKKYAGKIDLAINIDQMRNR